MQIAKKNEHLEKNCFNQNKIKIYTLHCKKEPFLPHKKGNILPLIYQY